MKEIRNIIFDLGGVLLSIDYEKTTRAFRDLGVENFDERFSQLQADPLFSEFEKGKVTETAFFEAMKTAAGDDMVTEMQIRDSWNAMLLEFRTESLAYLLKLKDRYKLYLLSNTNIIHLEAFNAIFASIGGEKKFEEYFDEVYFSHRIGLRKPDAGAFEYVLQQNNLLASETLFIDDTIPNIETAIALGMRTQLLGADMRVEDLGLV